MKKITAIFISLLLIVLSIYSCSTNEFENDASSNTSSNVSNASSGIIGEVSDNSINESGTSSDVYSDDYENNSTALEISTPVESKPDALFPEESDIYSGDESDNENSTDNESEDISATSSDIPTHTCSFVKGKTTAPTCTEQGFTVYTCSCGKSENRNEVAALGHNDGKWETVKEATTTSTGLKQIKCTRCGTVTKEEIIPKVVSDADKYNVPATAENAKLLEERILYYLNKYREEEGVSKAEFLWNGKMYQYAKMRAEQIVDDFSHNREDIIEVCNKLKFGYYHGAYSNSYIDSSGKTIYTGELCEPYYYGGCSEAITKGYGATSSWTVDYLAKKVATTIRNSSGHWSYVGAETTKYISVGGFGRGTDDYTSWYFCIATSSTDKYDSNRYDDKYYYDWGRWQDNYEYEVECWLGVKTNPLVEGKYGTNPERTEPWWDEWIAEMLSKGLIDQAWYDDMFEKGYIIEVD